MSQSVKRKLTAFFFVIILILCTFTSCKDTSEHTPLSTIPIQQEYDYPYLGLKLSLPESILKQLNSGNCYMDITGQLAEDNQINFIVQFINDVPKEQRNNLPSTETEFFDWLSKTNRTIAVGIYSIEFLEQYNISELSGCSEHTEIGKSSDETYIYYLSSNPENKGTAAQASDIQMNLYDREPAPPAGESFDVLGKPRITAGSIGDFKTEDIYGNEITKNIFSDYDLTMVNVFATWCNPCLEEIPYLAELDQELASQSVNIIGIVMDVNENGTINQDKLQLAQQIAEKTGAKYEFLLPDSVLLSGRLQGINAYPETFFVDREGNIVGSYYVGSRSKTEWEAIINQELSSLQQ